MKRALFILCLTGLGTVAQSCVDDQAAVYITAALSRDDSCLAESDSPTLSNASYDPDSGFGYVMTLRVESQLINRQTDIAADPSGVHITEADVSLLGIDGSTLATGAPNPFRIPAGGYIPSSDDGTPSAGIVTLTAIPGSVGAGLAGAPGGVVIIHVELHGETNGKLDIDSPPFEYPVSIANLCTTLPAAASTCTPGQDGKLWLATACPP